MKITESRNDSTIEIKVEGRVDTTTSPQLQQSILTAFQKGSRVIVNLEAVDYVSSAGLRALLLGQKTAMSKGGSMILTNVKDSVMGVLQVSGFSKILQIE